MSSELINRSQHTSGIILTNQNPIELKSFPIRQFNVERANKQVSTHKWNNFNQSESQPNEMLFYLTFIKFSEPGSHNMTEINVPNRNSHLTKALFLIRFIILRSLSLSTVDFDFYVRL